MIRRPPRSTQSRSSAASDVYKRQVTGASGQTSRLIKRWRFSPEPNTLLARLEAAYFAGLESVDLVETKTQINKTSGKFTRDGARDDVLNYALNSLIPGLH